MSLWNVLEQFVENGIEARKVDLKLLLDLSTRPGRAEFAKDVTAMTNTRGGQGYLVVGVKDAADRIENDPDDYISGFVPDDLQAFEQQIVQALTHFCEPAPEVHLQQLSHPAAPDRPISVVTIPRQFGRPYRITRSSGKVKEGCYVRRGSHTERVSVDDVQTGPAAVVVNFGRKIESDQEARLRELLNLEIEEIIDIPHQLDVDRSYRDQALESVRRVGLTEDEWASLPLVVNVHPFAPMATAIMACIHGLRGNFPNVIRMRQDSENSQFTVAELLPLQTLRNEARSMAATL